MTESRPRQSMAMQTHGGNHLLHKHMSQRPCLLWDIESIIMIISSTIHEENKFLVLCVEKVAYHLQYLIKVDMSLFEDYHLAISLKYC